MKPAGNPEASKLQSSKPHESHSDTDSNLIWSEYKTSLRAAETNFDIATTHKSNEELRQCDTVKNFFTRAAKVKSLKEYDTRNWIGSLPSTMAEWAVPLFTDENGTDFQLHLSYTWMGALHTAGTKSAKVVDPYVHRLLHVINSDKLEVIQTPNIVIPLGKLFVNKYSHSTWTGYEIFVSNKLNLWIIYVLDEVDPEALYPDEVRLSRWDVPGSGKEGQNRMGESPIIKIACLWDSFATIESATYEKAENQVRRSSTGNYVGTIYLLELSRTVASQYIQMGLLADPETFATSKFEIDADSSAGGELLLLANENAKMPIMELKFNEELAQQNISHYRDLLSVAIEHADETIIKLLLLKGKVNLDLEDGDRIAPISYAAANAVMHAAEFATSYAAARTPSINYSLMDDEFLKVMDTFPRFPFSGPLIDEEDPDQVAYADDAAGAAVALLEYAAQVVAERINESPHPSFYLAVVLSAAVSAAVFVAADVVLQHVGRPLTEDTTNYEFAVSSAARSAVGYSARYIRSAATASINEDFIDERSDNEAERAGKDAWQIALSAVYEAVSMVFSSKDYFRSRDAADEDAEDAEDTQLGVFAAQYTKEYAAAYIDTYNEDRILKLLKEYKHNYKRPTGDIQEESSLRGQRSSETTRVTEH